MSLISKEEFLKGANFREMITYSNTKKMMNSNAQFIIDLSIKVKMYPTSNLPSSFSISSLAVHLCHYYFHFKSFLNYDRFIVSAAALFLSCKIFDTPLDIGKLSSSYFKLQSLINQKEVDIVDQVKVQEISQKICQAESDLLNVVEFKLEYNVPYRSLETIYKTHLTGNKPIYFLGRIFILDIYRTGASLFHSIETIAVAAIIYALTVHTGEVLVPKLYQKVKANCAKQAEKEGIINSNDINLMLKSKVEHSLKNWINNL